MAPRPRKRKEVPIPPTAVWPAERAVAVEAKAPTANPPTAPTAAPRKNLVVPSATPRLLPAAPSSTGASLAQRFAPKPGPDCPGYTCRRMLETGKRERLRGLPAVDAVLRDPAGSALIGRHGRAAAPAAGRAGQGGGAGCPPGRGRRAESPRRVGAHRAARPRRRDRRRPVRPGGPAAPDLRWRAARGLRGRRRRARRAGPFEQGIAPGRQR